MVDRNTFMETLHSVQEIARVSGNQMDRETALSYFKDMDLSPEQEELVYQFLLLSREEASAEPKDVEAEEDFAAEDVEGDRTTEGEATVTGKSGEEASDEESAQTHFQMYRDEVEELKEMEAVMEAKMYQSLLQGDASVIEALSTQWLKRVITIAEDYQGKGSLLDDLVQEGNIGLLMELHQMTGSEPETKTVDLAAISRRLVDAIKNAIELYLGEESGEDQQSETILAKVSLVHEAQKLLTEEKGEQPSLRQLAEYTRISEEEISDILSLVKKK